MNKSLLALAVMGLWMSTASAQSSVTVYGKLDQALAKNVGTDDKAVADNTGSRLGFRGAEDLGNGYKAIFGIEHRFNPDTGTQANASTFWQGYSTVGLVSPFGTINLGRQYPAAWLIQNALDPFAAETVAQIRDVGVRPRTSNFSASGAQLGATRVADSVRYDYSGHGIAFAASVAEPTSATLPDRHVSAGLTYTSGPIFVGVGYEDMSGDNDKLLTVGGAYTFGFGKLLAGYSDGKTNADLDAKAWMVGGILPFGALDVKVGYAQTRLELASGGHRALKKGGISLQYNLSKRTKVYTSYARIGGDLDPVSADNKNGYDFGIQHNF